MWYLFKKNVILTTTVGKIVTHLKFFESTLQTEKYLKILINSEVMIYRTRNGESLVF